MYLSLDRNRSRVTFMEQLLRVFVKTRIIWIINWEFIKIALGGNLQDACVDYLSRAKKWHLEFYSFDLVCSKNF